MYDYIDPAFGIPLAVILWTVLLIVTLASLRAAKLRRDKKFLADRRARRRATHIQMLVENESSFTERLNK